MNMKKIIMGVMLLMSIAVSAQNVRSYYSKSRQNVYFRGREVKGADVRTFIELGHGYGKDGFQVFYMGDLLPYVDATSFRLKGQGTNSSYDEYLPDAALPGTALGDGYSKDDFNVYFNGHKIDASEMSFRRLGGGYGMDDFNVYYLGRKLKDASVLSFKYIGDGVGVDDFNKFYNGRKVRK